MLVSITIPTQHPTSRRAKSTNSGHAAFPNRGFSVITDRTVKTQPKWHKTELLLKGQLLPRQSRIPLTQIHHSFSWAPSCDSNRTCKHHQNQDRLTYCAAFSNLGVGVSTIIPLRARMILCFTSNAHIWTRYGYFYTGIGFNAISYVQVIQKKLRWKNMKVTSRYGRWREVMSFLTFQVS